MKLLVSLLSLGLALQLAELQYMSGSTPTSQTMTFSTGSRFDGLPNTNYFTLHAWASFFDDSSSLVDIWVIKNDANEELALRRKFPDSLQVSKDSNSISFTRSLQMFKWTFISLSMRLGSPPTFCSGDWGTSSLTCDPLPYAFVFVFTATPGTVQVSQPNELYDFQLVLRDLSKVELKSMVLSTSCHEVCASCIGPSHTACSEFIPIVRMSHPDDSDFSVGDIQYRGRKFPSVNSIAVTGWARINGFSGSGSWSGFSGSGSWSELFRVSTQK
jgi:hypothetical protein